MTYVAVLWSRNKFHNNIPGKRSSLVHFSVIDFWVFVCRSGPTGGGDAPAVWPGVQLPAPPHLGRRWLGWELLVLEHNSLPGLALQWQVGCWGGADKPAVEHPEADPAYYDNWGLQLISLLYETGGCNPLNPLPGSAPDTMHMYEWRRYCKLLRS